MDTAGSFSWVKLPGREANHSPSPSAEVKIDGAMPPLPQVFTGIVLNKKQGELPFL
jgi:hypothetical protein